MYRKYERVIQIASSLLFACGAVYALQTGEIIYAFLLFVMILVSISYHAMKPLGPDWWWNRNKSYVQHVLLFVDTLWALVVFVYGMGLFYIRGFPPSFWWAFVVFVPLLVQMLNPKRNLYVLQHGVWHLGAALVAVLPLV